jgi:hypothetical protein
MSKTDMGPARMSAKETRETARSLEKSLQSSHQGLVLLLQSFRRADLSGAASSYRQMQLVLVQQRLWARAYDRNELTPLWKKIAATAAEIHEILADFGAIMAELKAIDRIEAAEVAASGDNGDAAPLGAHASPKAPVPRPIDPGQTTALELLAAELTLSAARATRLFHAAPEQSKEILDSLIEQGVLEIDGRRSYRLTEAARTALVQTLLAQLQERQTP